MEARVQTAGWGARHRIPWSWVDAWWLVFLAGLAALPPRHEIHKQLILIAFAVLQLSEARVVRKWPRAGPVAAVAVKIALATLLVAHTRQVPINSSYFPIFYVPVVTAALLFGPWATIAWTAATAAAYLSYLWPALEVYRLDQSGRDELALRVFFMFLLALIINRFVVETRRQAAALLDSHRKLARAQAETRRAERLAALGQLSAGLAHEIRNPLAVIKGSAEMLEQQAPAGLVAELATYISSETDRVNTLVSRFLEFARPAPITKTQASVGAVIEQACDDTARRYPDSRVRIERDIEPSLMAPMDVTLMERAFANLAANAVEALTDQATPDQGTPGEGTLRISARAADAERGGVDVAFEDSGPGVPGELREQIFNPFFTTKSQGVGLGLAIVAKIVDQHGGTLKFVPAAMGGASFHIHLPAE